MKRKVALSDPTHLMSMVDLVAISVETLHIDSGCFFKKEFTKLICMNPWVILYLTINHVDSFHGYAPSILTQDAKDIL